jgi:hypothetical protein
MQCLRRPTPRNRKRRAVRASGGAVMAGCCQRCLRRVGLWRFMPPPTARRVQSQGTGRGARPACGRPARCPLAVRAIERFPGAPWSRAAGLSIPCSLPPFNPLRRHSRTPLQVVKRSEAPFGGQGNHCSPSASSPSSGSGSACRLAKYSCSVMAGLARRCGPRLSNKRLKLPATREYVSIRRGSGSGLSASLLSRRSSSSVLARRRIDSSASDPASRPPRSAT